MRKSLIDFKITSMSAGKSGKINFVLIFCQKVGVQLICEGDLYVNHYGSTSVVGWHISVSGTSVEGGISV